MTEQPFRLSFDNTEAAFAYLSDKELKKTRFIFSIMHDGWLVKAGSVLAPAALKLRLPVKGLIRNTVFKQFCGGENLEEAALTAQRLARFNVGVILDYGVEASEGEENYDHAIVEFKKAIEHASLQSNIPFISLKVTGFAQLALLEKIHAGDPLTGEEKQEFGRVRQRIYTICKHAFDHHIGVLIDAEESWIQQPVDDLADEMMAEFNKEKGVIYNTFQLYRHDRLGFLKRSFTKAQQNNYTLGAKLVRGAYMEKERKRAADMNYPSLIQKDKDSTDQDYNEAVRFCIDHLEDMAVFIGTHNEESSMLGARLLHEKGISHDYPDVHFSQLYGMSDNITFNLAKAGYPVSKYLPYGPVKDVLPYLIRRAEENSSIAGQMGRELSLINAECKRRGL
ncbi:MAG: proline dehydrogenase [Chitinophagaceae bacterium]|nr:MAG: proline dehydrogenase [Chitinophagaceae bacterium]